MSDHLPSLDGLPQADEWLEIARRRRSALHLQMAALLPIVLDHALHLGFRRGAIQHAKHSRDVQTSLYVLLDSVRITATPAAIFDIDRGHVRSRATESERPFSRAKSPTRPAN